MITFAAMFSLLFFGWRFLLYPFFLLFFFLFFFLLTTDAGCWLFAKLLPKLHVGLIQVEHLDSLDLTDRAL
jgi:hypothetical protein